VKVLFTFAQEKYPLYARHTRVVKWWSTLCQKASFT